MRHEVYAFGMSLLLLATELKIGRTAAANAARAVPTDTQRSRGSSVQTGSRKWLPAFFFS